VLETVDALLAQGVSPAAILEMCREAMSIIGRRFEAGEAFIPELIMSGEIMKEVSAKVRPYLGETSSGAHLGCVIIGTVRGDVHDIGKDIVGTVLGVAGFKVVDLGADVPPAAFAEAVRGEGTCIVALSCLLTTGFESMKETVQALIEAGLREQAKVMVGERPSPPWSVTTRAPTGGAATQRPRSISRSGGRTEVPSERPDCSHGWPHRRDLCGLERPGLARAPQPSARALAQPRGSRLRQRGHS